jgi:hypothetical protein
MQFEEEKEDVIIRKRKTGLSIEQEFEVDFSLSA